MTAPYLTRSVRRPTAAVLATSLALAASGLTAASAYGDGGGGGLSGSPAPPGVTTTTTTSTAPTATAPVTAPTAGQLVIHGGGDGHGVGMSQYGAEGFALHGFTDRQILAHYYMGTSLGHTDPHRIVRVLLADGHASFSGATGVGGTRISATKTYTVSVGVGDQLDVVAPNGHTVARSTGMLAATGRIPLTTGGKQYRGSLQFTADSSGGVRTVNAVGLDDYVEGVVADEMLSSWAPAALETQAIAARTYAITTTVNGDGYDLYDDTRSQMYGGVAAETATSDAAVSATAGQIVTSAGRPAVTYFFASSGGHTESIQNVWSGSPADSWLQGVPDPYDAAAGDPYHSWTVTMSVAKATRRLGSLVDGTLRRIVVTQHGVSPRIISADVIGTDGTTTVSGSDLAQAFGLMSTDATFAVGH